MLEPASPLYSVHWRYPLYSVHWLYPFRRYPFPPSFVQDVSRQASAAVKTLRKESALTSHWMALKREREGGRSRNRH